MAIKTTLNLDELEYGEAQRLAHTSGVTVGEYVTRALRDARLRAWHHRPTREPADVPESLLVEEERERETAR